ncbi:COG4315 family predicted lipoprotein [Nakamurella aerolata]|uniref:Lipoprotein with Yx(FWY)xxD motif n=1 Tax=Nakamurella aerolata TaxID=1656892 RepID=A0A849A813_9ACTN|nr:hypothetical protein [Nakamurella aerolata]NNG35746.1 hypothetical protein [Nakamurella aerolata]
MKTLKARKSLVAIAAAAALTLSACGSSSDSGASSDATTGTVATATSGTTATSSDDSAAGGAGSSSADDSATSEASDDSSSAASSDDSATGGAAGSSADDSTKSGGGADGLELETESTALGEIVVDGDGKTIYVFDKDTKGASTSACTGKCLGLWPLALTSGTPQLKGVSGTVGTIDTADGKKQVTLDGLPLYYYVKDTKPGDVAGQGVGGVWWVIGADGAKVTSPAPSK